MQVYPSSSFSFAYKVVCRSFDSFWPVKYHTIQYISLAPSCLESVAAAPRTGRLHVAVLLGGSGGAVGGGGLAGGPQDRQVAKVLRPLQRPVAPHLEFAQKQQLFTVKKHATVKQMLKWDCSFCKKIKLQEDFSKCERGGKGKREGEVCQVQIWIRIPRKYFGSGSGKINAVPADPDPLL